MAKIRLLRLSRTESTSMSRLVPWPRYEATRRLSSMGSCDSVDSACREAAFSTESFLLCRFLPRTRNFRLLNSFLALGVLTKWRPLGCVFWSWRQQPDNCREMILSWMLLGHFVADRFLNWSIVQKIEYVVVLLAKKWWHVWKLCFFRPAYERMISLFVVRKETTLQVSNRALVWSLNELQSGLQDPATH